MNSYKIIGADHFHERDKPYAIKVFIVSATYRKAINRFRKKYPNTGSSLQVIAHTKEFINWLNYKAYN